MPWHKICTNNKTIVIVTISLILGVASFLRLWQLNKTPPGLYHDEAMNVNQAREAWRERDFKIFYPENNGREGLFINIQALSMAAFGATPFAARLPSAVFGILTVLGIFFLTKELFQPALTWRGRSDRMGLFASFFLATSFWHINFSRIGFRAIMAPFFLVWSFYFLWKLMKRLQGDHVIATPRSGGSNPVENNGIAEPVPSTTRDLPPRNDAPRSTLYALLGGLLFGLGFHSYIAYRVAPLLLIIPFFIGWQSYRRQARSEKREACAPCLLALFLFFAFIVVLPLGAYFLGHPADFTGRSAQVSIFSSETPLHDLGKNILTTTGMFFFHGDYNWRHNFSGSPQVWWPVSMLFLTGFIVSLRDLIRKSKFKNLFLFSWFLIFLLPVVLSNEGLPHALRALPLVIPVFIFAAVGLEWVIDKKNKWLNHARERAPEKSAQLNRINRELVIFLFVWLAAVGMHGFNQYFLRWSWNPNVYDAFNGRYADLGRYLAHVPSATKKYIIVNTPGHMRVDNIPMPAQTVMFFTDTWNKTERAKKQFIYISSVDNLSLLPQTLSSPTIIAMLENDPALRHELKTRYPELISKITDGGVMLTNLK